MIEWAEILSRTTHAAPKMFRSTDSDAPEVDLAERESRKNARISECEPTPIQGYAEAPIATAAAVLGSVDSCNAMLNPLQTAHRFADKTRLCRNTSAVCCGVHAAE